MSRRLRAAMVLGTATMGLMLSLSMPAQAARTSLNVFATTTNNRLLSIEMRERSFFNRRSIVLSLKSSRAITGLTAGDTIVGIDFRPATGALIALAKNGGTGRLYTINTATGAATLKSTLAADPGDVTAPFPFTTLSGLHFGIDFNPAADRLRIVSDRDQNLRVNVNTGATQLDVPLNFAAGDSNTDKFPNITGVGYTNSFAGAPNLPAPAPPTRSTTLYGLDEALDVLVIQAPPNNGTLNTVVGPLGVNLPSLVGFDIAASDNTGVAVSGDGDIARFYFIDLTSGKATSVESVKVGSTLRGLAIPLDQ